MVRRESEGRSFKEEKGKMIEDEGKRVKVVFEYRGGKKEE